MSEELKPLPAFCIALDVSHRDCHRAADAFWTYWKANGETHRHGYYESTWGAINQALKLVGVHPHYYGATPPEVAAAPATSTDAPFEPKCACGDRPASQCDEEWGPKCDLGNNPDHVRRVHDLKTDPDVFDAVAAGLKTHEIRKDDRGFLVGDVLCLRRTEHTGADMAAGAPLVYSGPQVNVRVSYILRGPIYGLADGWCVLSFATQPAASTSVQGEAVAWLYHDGESIEAVKQSSIAHSALLSLNRMPGCRNETPLYAATQAPASAPVPLSDERIAACWPTSFAMPSSQREKLLAFARAVLAAAGIPTGETT